MARTGKSVAIHTTYWSEPTSVEIAGWRLPNGIWASLTQAEKEFVSHEMAGLRTPDYYLSRLRALGFDGLGRVLDAGCGIGQWTHALARLNGAVDGIDVNERRVTFARALRDAYGQNNANLCVSPLEATPFNDDAFDGVFCYGVFMFTDMPVTLREFRRVLKPGGRLYVNANSWGWHFHLVFDRGLRRGNWALTRTAWRMMWRGVRGDGRCCMVRSGWLRRELTKAGFEIRAMSVEGHAPIEMLPAGTPLPPPAYPSQFYGFRSIIELIAV